jgi:hypothetical protein
VIRHFALRELLVRWGAQSIGVVVFAPLVLMLLPAQADLWVGRRWMVARKAMRARRLCPKPRRALAKAG